MPKESGSKRRSKENDLLWESCQRFIMSIAQNPALGQPGELRFWGLLKIGIYDFVIETVTTARLTSRLMGLDDGYHCAAGEIWKKWMEIDADKVLFTQWLSEFKDRQTAGRDALAKAKKQGRMELEKALERHMCEACRDGNEPRRADNAWLHERLDLNGNSGPPFVCGATILRDHIAELDEEGSI